MIFGGTKSLFPMCWAAGSHRGALWVTGNRLQASRPTMAEGRLPSFAAKNTQRKCAFKGENEKVGFFNTIAARVFKWTDWWFIQSTPARPCAGEGGPAKKREMQAVFGPEASKKRRFLLSNFVFEKQNNDCGLSILVKPSSKQALSKLLIPIFSKTTLALRLLALQRPEVGGYSGPSLCDLGGWGKALVFSFLVWFSVGFRLVVCKGFLWYILPGVFCFYWKYVFLSFLLDVFFVFYVVLLCCVLWFCFAWQSSSLLTEWLGCWLCSDAGNSWVVDVNSFGLTKHGFCFWNSEEVGALDTCGWSWWDICSIIFHGLDFDVLILLSTVICMSNVPLFLAFSFRNVDVSLFSSRW